MPPNKPGQNISKAIVQAQEQERQYISSELHDDVNQLILTAKLHIEMMKKEVPGLEKVEEYLLRAIEGVKRITHRLSGIVLLHDGIEKSITGIVESMTLLNIHVKTDLDLALLTSLSPGQQLMLYRVLQEQSSNILKYAGASKVHISISGREGFAELIISDNGRGFDREKIKPGIGLMNIYNRAIAFNGSVEITSSPGAGCTLLLNFPLHE